MRRLPATRASSPAASSTARGLGAMTLLRALTGRGGMLGLVASTAASVECRSAAVVHVSSNVSDTLDDIGAGQSRLRAETAGKSASVVPKEEALARAQL